jgi:hypothetical protein
MMVEWAAVTRTRRVYVILSMGRGQRGRKTVPLGDCRLLSVILSGWLSMTPDEGLGSWPEVSRSVRTPAVAVSNCHRKVIL